MPRGRIGAGGPFLVSEQPETSAPAPFIPEDWPPLPKVQQAGGIQVTASLLVTLLSATVVQRAPLFSPLPKQPPPFEYRVPNLLASTLAPPAASTQMPSTPLDQDALPPALWRPTEVQNNLLLTTLAPQIAAQPFHYTDFGQLPAPRGLFAYTPNNLLTTTLTPAQAATPFIPLDWPALPRAQPLVQFNPPNLLLGVLTGQTKPFTPSNWYTLPTIPLPTGDVQGTNLALLTTPQPMPFAQLSWPPLPVPVSAVPFLIPNTTINQVAPAAPPNIHKLYLDVSTGRLFWQVSVTSNPTLIEPL